MPDDHIWNNETSLYWFDKVVQSTTFNAITMYALDDKGEPTFEEVANAEHRGFYKNLYEKNLVYYKKFIEECNV